MIDVNEDVRFMNKRVTLPQHPCDIYSSLLNMFFLKNSQFLSQNDLTES